MINASRWVMAVCLSCSGVFVCSSAISFFGDCGDNGVPPLCNNPGGMQACSCGVGVKMYCPHNEISPSKSGNKCCQGNPCSDSDGGQTTDGWQYVCSGSDNRGSLRWVKTEVVKTGSEYDLYTCRMK